MVYKLLTPFSQSVFQMTNVAGLFSKYNGVTITGTKRMSSNWQGTLSLVLSKSEGREPASIARPGRGAKRHIRQDSGRSGAALHVRAVRTISSTPMVC